MPRLVVEINDFWGIYEVDGDLVPLPREKVYCPMVYGDGPCYGELLLHDFRAYHHPGTDHYHVDVHMKCSRCGRHYTYGLPMPPEYLERLRRSKYHGRTLRLELGEIYKLPEGVEDRLKSWGYW